MMVDQFTSAEVCARDDMTTTTTTGTLFNYSDTAVLADSASVTVTETLEGEKLSLLEAAQGQVQEEGEEEEGEEEEGEEVEAQYEGGRGERVLPSPSIRLSLGGQTAVAFDRSLTSEHTSSNNNNNENNDDNDENDNNSTTTPGTTDQQQQQRERDLRRTTVDAADLAALLLDGSELNDGSTMSGYSHTPGSQRASIGGSASVGGVDDNDENVSGEGEGDHSLNVSVSGAASVAASLAPSLASSSVALSVLPSVASPVPTPSLPVPPASVQSASMQSVSVQSASVKSHRQATSQAAASPSARSTISRNTSGCYSSDHPSLQGVSMEVSMGGEVMPTDLSITLGSVHSAEGGVHSAHPHQPMEEGEESTWRDTGVSDDVNGAGMTGVTGDVPPSNEQASPQRGRARASWLSTVSQLTTDVSIGGVSVGAASVGVASVGGVSVGGVSVASSGPFSSTKAPEVAAAGAVASEVAVMEDG